MISARFLKPNALTAWLLALVALSAACSDNPLTVDAPEAQPEAVAFADGETAGLASQQGDITDTFTPRFDLSIRVVGALVPRSTVVIQLEATANEAISAGTVDLVLPTMAGMAYSGADKHPRFPPSGKLPAIGSWTISQLARGASWKRSVSIRLPEKGYYHVAVDVRTTGPDPQGMGPYLINDIHRQAWMLVVEDGGLLTPQFETSVFPDRIAPQPGPFRTRPGTAQPQPRAAAQLASSSSSYTWLELVYYDGRRQVPAEGAHAQGRLYGQADSSRQTLRWRAPSNGLIKLSCAQPFEYWRGSAHLAGLGVCAERDDHLLLGRGAARVRRHNSDHRAANAVRSLEPPERSDSTDQQSFWLQQVTGQLASVPESARCPVIVGTSTR